jgi:hypothetical protein
MPDYRLEFVYAERPTEVHAEQSIDGGEWQPLETFEVGLYPLQVYYVDTAAPEIGARIRLSVGVEGYEVVSRPSNEVVVTTVPEPGVTLGLLAGAALLAVLRRIR